MKIELIAGRWHVNGKSFQELTPNERIILDNFFEDYKNGKELASEIVIDESLKQVLKELI